MAKVQVKVINGEKHIKPMGKTIPIGDVFDGIIRKDGLYTKYYGLKK